LEFIKCKENDKEITNFNISVALTEEFMKKVIDDEEYNLIDPHTKRITARLKAREVFNLIVEMAWKNGEPGIIFIDRINKDNPTPKLGEIESTNPCVTGNSLVSTEHGLMRMRDIVRYFKEGGLRVATDDRVAEILYSHQDSGNIAVKARPGVTFSSISQAFFTGVREVYRLVTESGYELEATGDHKVMTNEGWVRLVDLKKNKHKVLIQSGEGKFSEDKYLPFPVINDFIGDNGKRSMLNLPSEWSKELGQILGWIVGDGWLRDGDKNCRLGLTFSKEDKEILDYFKPILNSWYGYDIREVERENGVYHLSYHSKYFVEFFRYLGIKPWQSDDKEVPKFIYTAPKEAVIGFLQGLFTADGTVGLQKVNNTTYIRLTAKSHKLLKGVQLLLLNLGIFSKIYNRSRPKRSGFPYRNVKGEKKLYILDGTCYELQISRDNIKIFLEKIGFLCKKHREKVDVLMHQNFYSCIFEDRILEVKKIGIRDVYDLTENRSNSFICNGLCISNCGEQPLLPFESCNLGSINLSKVISERDGKKEIDWEKLKRLVHLGVHFLDNVIDMNKFPLKEIEENTKKNRKIGLGVMGWADMLVHLDIPYNSDEAVELAEKLMSFIDEQARTKSRELAETRGAFPSFYESIFVEKGEKRRNATLTTVAPTGTISIISNTSSGIEPLFALSYFRNVMDNDKLVEVNPLFEEVAKREGFYSRKLMEVVAERGSIKDIDDVPEKYKKIFVTAHDIAPIWHIRMQAAFQKYTDNAVSKTVNFHADAVKEDVREVYMLAYKLGCKGVTIYRDKSRDEQVLNINSNSKNNNNITNDNPGTKEKSVAPRPRPTVTTGTTTKVTTGCGNLYITINVDDRNTPFEVFIQMGKAGGCAASQLEAVGRLVSLALRSGVENKKIIDQLRGIRCPSPSWEKGGRIFSCADAIARVLELRLGNGKMHHKDEDLERHSPHTMIEDKLGNVVGVCPDCGAALRHEEGCVVCRSCGYSKC
jgi:ribonucleoside-diphosphate reductase alpha chain